jgi:hypothetical protein
MSTFAYSPNTGELIRTETPADWMGVTDTEPPVFDSATAGCFWRQDHWEIVVAQPLVASVPNIISMRQARLALLQAGLLDTVSAAMVTPEEKIWWDYSTVVDRNNALVLQKTAAIGISSEQLDSLFVLAGTL